MEDIKQFIEDNPSWGWRRIGKKFDLTHSQAQVLIRKYRKTKINKVIKMNKTTNILKGAIDADIFIDQFDVPKKITNALPLLNGKIILDSNFRSSLGIDTISWARARELPEFEQYQKEVKGKLYWANPDIFQELQHKMDIL